MTALRLLLVRHCQTDWNAEKRIQGHADIPLNQTGIQQAHDLKDLLANMNISHCFTSDLQRASQTAEIIVNGLNIPIHTEKRLREKNYGIWEGRFTHELPSQLTNVEPDDAMKWRLGTFLDELPGKNLKGTVLIVTHWGIMKVFLCSLLNAVFDHRNFSLGPNSYLTVDLCNDSWQLHSLHKISL